MFWVAPNWTTPLGRILPLHIPWAIPLTNPLPDSSISKIPPTTPAGCPHHYILTAEDVEEALHDVIMRGMNDIIKDARRRQNLPVFGMGGGVIGGYGGTTEVKKA